MGVRGENEWLEGGNYREKLILALSQTLLVELCLEACPSFTDRTLCVVVAQTFVESS